MSDVKPLWSMGTGLLGYLLSALFWFIHNYNPKDGGTQDETEITIVLFFISVPLAVEVAALILGLQTRQTLLGKFAIVLSLIFLCPAAWLLLVLFR